MGISGEEIRREQEESRQRSRVGRREETSFLPTELSVAVGGIEIDWFVPMLACASRGVGKLGLVFSACLIGLRFLTSRTVTVKRDGASVYAVVTRPWPYAGRAVRIEVTAATLRYWNGWSSRYFQLLGSEVSISASVRSGRRIWPPTGVPAARVERPRLRSSARAMALNLPNVLVMGGSVAAVWNVEGYSSLVWALAILCGASSLGAYLVGAPDLRVEKRDE
jgi:hypothetical protein